LLGRTSSSAAQRLDRPCRAAALPEIIAAVVGFDGADVLLSDGTRNVRMS
jgi:hypothetical protein